MSLSSTEQVKEEKKKIPMNQALSCLKTVPVFFVVRQWLKLVESTYKCLGMSRRGGET